MMYRLRRLRISLAAKCQLLFGAAVVLIIAAALFVPWQRMEQLTEQLNERAAGALAENAVAEHVARHATAVAPPAPRPAGPGRPGSAAQPATSPGTRPAGGPAAGTTARHADPARDGVPAARIVPLDASRDATETSRFDHRAMSYLARHPDRMVYSSYYDRGDGTKGYRFARPVYFEQTRCERCHTPATPAAPPPADPRAEAGVAAGARAGPAGRAGSPADGHPAPTQPTDPPPAAQAAVPATDGRIVPLRVDPDSKRAGVVSVDIGSRIDATELLLNRVFILLAGSLAGGLAIVTFYFITTRLILQPVRVLQETAEKVSKGDLNIRSDISTGDEFQQLSETFNVMLFNLKRNADQLRSINKGLDLRLGQLAETNVALYESNRLKSEFLANVSHELRTPLNSILGFAELLKDTIDAPADARGTRYVNNIMRSGRNLLDLINDLLDLAKIEAGRMEIRSEPLSLSDLFEGLATLLRPLAEQKKVQIVPAVAADVPIVYSDPGKLQQVLYNFLSNAIKFCPDGSVIDLTAALADAGHVRVAVADRGPGIDPDKHAVIFEKFRQIDSSHTRAHSGTGLGLAISKELTALMGGTIGVDSRPGDGATFWVVLPLKTEAGQADVRGRLVVA